MRAICAKYAQNGDIKGCKTGQNRENWRNSNQRRGGKDQNG